MKCTVNTYYAMLMAQFVLSIKIITKPVLQCADSSQPGWFHVETYSICVFLGCDLPIHLLLK